MKHNSNLQLNESVECPIQKVSQILGDMWIMLIVKELLTGGKRFNELHRILVDSHSPNKISTKTLADRLKFLKEIGLIKKNITEESHVCIEYELTKKGRGLQKIFDDIKKYGEEYL